MTFTPTIRSLCSYHVQRCASPPSHRLCSVPFIRHEPRISFSTGRIFRADTPEAQAISEVAKAEGGPTKGSESSKMQSELAKQRNAEQGTSSVNSNKSPEGQVISEVAHAEGGTTKGSQSAKMQSEITKQKNAEQGAYGAMSSGTTGSAKSPAGEAISEVAHAEGGTKKGSLSAKMQSEVTKQKNAEQGLSGSLSSGTGASAKTPIGQAISEVAHAEGGTTKRSKSAQMQSEITKAMNANQTVSEGSGTGGTAESSVRQAISEVAQAEGGPSKGSMSAQMQSELDKANNAQGGSGTGKSPDAQAISEVAHAEGGTTKGSQSAKMQSELTKARNAEQGI